MFVTTRGMSKNLTAAYASTGALAGFGLILLLSSIAVKKPNHPKTKTGLQVSGGLFLAVGLISLLVMLILKATEPKHASSSGSTTSKPAQTAAALAVSAAPPSAVMPAPERSKIKWQDQTSPALPLERIKQFDETESPIAVAASPIELSGAHVPKLVPARPRQKGYISAIEPATPQRVQQMAADFEPYQIETVVAGGPVYYLPEYNYPVVGDMIQEREEFLSREDTPELARHRRVCDLREAALSLGPMTQRDGLMVPIAAPPN